MATEDLRRMIAEIDGGLPPFGEIDELSRDMVSSTPDGDPFSFLHALLDKEDPVFLEAVRIGREVVKNTDLEHGNVGTLVDEAYERFYHEHYGEPVNYGLAWSRLNVVKVLGWTVGVASELESMMNGDVAVEGYRAS